ncbi:LacI family DNA-binding transcriptional regulator [Rathayibacter sp. KR2-224]|uniref:LacI family DNA-binding transcriptional regulator n=1 Tax=Rathayibacter sp. KR2-224 TaxID=3400913 RepID=UPI003BFEE477
MALSASMVTLQDVADAARVSISTASRALAGRGDLKSETRNEVLRVAAELGYDPSGKARGRPAALDLRLIELVLGTFDDSWTAAIVSGARKAAFANGYDLVLTLERDEPADDWPARVARRRPSGVILGIIRPTRKQLHDLTAARIPIVLVDPRSDPHGELASIGTTDWQGGYDAGSHLARAGLRRFVIITGVPHYRFGKAREEGFRAAIADELGDAPVQRIDSGWSNADVTKEFAGAIKRSPAPIGVFGCNDEMALAVYRAAEELGLRIPEDVSVIGFNDEPRAASAAPPLTSVRQPLEAMAARAVLTVRDLRLKPRETFERVELPSRLVVRSSTLPLTERAD